MLSANSSSCCSLNTFRGLVTDSTRSAIGTLTYSGNAFTTAFVLISFLLFVESFCVFGGLFSNHSGSPQNRGAAVRTSAVRFDFAAFVTQCGGVFFANQNGFANLFERAPVSFEQF